MVKAKLNPTLARINFMFKLFGVWPKSEDNSKYREVWKLFVKLFHSLGFLSFLILILTFAITTEDENETIFVGLIFVIVTVLFVKMVYLLLKQKEILSFLSDSLVDVSNLDGEMKREISIKEDIFSKFSNVYLVIIMVGLICVVLSTLPIFTANRKLPFFIKFSLEWRHKDIFYWFLYIFMSWSSLLCCVYNSLTVFVWYILYNYAIQYQILGKQFKNIGATKNSCFLQDLVCLIQIHRNLYE